MKLLALTVFMLACETTQPVSTQREPMVCFEAPRWYWMGSCPHKDHTMTFEHDEWQCRCPKKTEKTP